MNKDINVILSQFDNLTHGTIHVLQMRGEYTLHVVRADPSRVSKARRRDAYAYHDELRGCYQGFTIDAAYTLGGDCREITLIPATDPMLNIDRVYTLKIHPGADTWEDFLQLYEDNSRGKYTVCVMGTIETIITDVVTTIASELGMSGLTAAELLEKYHDELLDTTICAYSVDYDAPYHPFIDSVTVAQLIVGEAYAMDNSTTLSLRMLDGSIREVEVPTSDKIRLLTRLYRLFQKESEQKTKEEVVDTYAIANEYLLYPIHTRGIPAEADLSGVRDLIENCILPHVSRKNSYDPPSVLFNRDGLRYDLMCSPPAHTVLEPVAGVNTTRGAAITKVMELLDTEVIIIEHVSPLAMVILSNGATLEEGKKSIYMSFYLADQINQQRENHD